MKKIILVFAFFSSHSFAQQQPQPTQQQNNQQSTIVQRDQTCLQRTLVATTYPPNPTGTPSIIEPNISAIRGCLALKKVSNRYGEDLGTPREQRTTTDAKVTCVLKAGYTIDYVSCTSAANAYNQILVLEAGLLATQQIRTSSSNTSIANDVAIRTASGDGQNAALDASISTNRNLSQMNTEQAMAYTAAVAYLGSKISSWTKTDLASLQAKCAAETTPSLSSAYMTLAEVPAPTCKDSLNYTYTNARSDMIANSAARAAFISAAAMYAAKGIAAGIKASQLSDIANLTETAKTETEDTTTTTATDTCTLESTTPECLALASTTTTSSGALTDTGGFEGTDFGVDTTGTTTADDTTTASTALDETNSVADASSPFSEDAKSASSILDPAAAASVSPGTSAGGGGGSAPSAGGGSASLGPDTSADSESASTAKTESSKIGYSTGSGGGFSATKKLEEGSNPFANLFENSKGSTNMDDGIADIGNADLDLFKKISSRYSKITEEKRIEARNIED